MTLQFDLLDLQSHTSFHFTLFEFLILTLLEVSKNLRRMWNNWTSKEIDIKSSMGWNCGIMSDVCFNFQEMSFKEYYNLSLQSCYMYTFFYTLLYPIYTRNNFIPPFTSQTFNSIIIKQPYHISINQVVKRSVQTALSFKSCRIG